MNCPSLSAAPRIWVSFETSRRMLPSVIISEECCSDEPVERRMSSEAAPYPSEAARPDVTQHINSQDKQ